MKMKPDNVTYNKLKVSTIKNLKITAPCCL